MARRTVETNAIKVGNSRTTFVFSLEDEFEIRLKNFRCFQDTGFIRITPLTLLTGENSSGKSSFLSALHVVRNLFSNNGRLNFSEPPFDLGSFDDIAYSTGQNIPSDHFEISLKHRAKVRANDDNAAVLHSYLLALEFCSIKGQPSLCSVELSIDGFLLKMSIKADCVVSGLISRGPDSVEFQSGEYLPKSVARTAFSAVENFLLFDHGSSARYRAMVASAGRRAGRKKDGTRADAVAEPSIPLSLDEWDELSSAWLAFATRFGTASWFPMAPVRSEPQRTYNPRNAAYAPTGSHAPQKLAELFRFDKTTWSDLQNFMDDFGRESGLFEKLSVRTFGSQTGDPFQVEVTIRKSKRNLVDVGYGISQIMPVIIDLHLAAGQSYFLLQQPEVHLHPRGQAALGTLFASLSSSSCYFVIETHSDFLIDRARLHVRNGEHECRKKMNLLYFEAGPNEVRITPVSVDEYGNVVSPTDSYRNFFLQEEAKLLGITNVLDH